MEQLEQNPRVKAQANQSPVRLGHYVDGRIPHMPSVTLSVEFDLGDADSALEAFDRCAASVRRQIEAAR